MRNYVWYLLLVLCSLPLFLYSLRRQRDRRVIALYLFMAGLTYTFEYIVLVLLRSYEYHPHIFATPYVDNIAGGIFSDAFVIPMTSTFVAVLAVRKGWALLIVAMIIGIESGFEQLGIYKHFWWSIWYTAVGLVMAFWVAKKWWGYLQENITHRVQYVSLAAMNIMIQVTMVFVVSGILGMYLYSVGWYSDPLRDHVAFAMIYIYLISFLFAYLIVYRAGKGWMTASLAALSGIDFFLYTHDLLWLSEKWALPYFVLLQILLLLILYGLYRGLLVNHDQVKAPV